MSQPPDPARDPYARDPDAVTDPYAPQPTQPIAYQPQPPLPYQADAYQPAQQAYPQPGYGYPPAGYGIAYPEASQATVALVLGILGVVLFSPLAPFAWSIGGKEKRAIDAGLRDPANRGTAVAGWVLGIIGTVLLGIALLFAIGYIIVIVFIVAGAAASAPLDPVATMAVLAG